MKIISFAHTSHKLILGEKTETRRFWDDKYASSFKSGDVCQAWSKSPRFKGQFIAIIKLVQDPFKQPLREVNDVDEISEGHLWGNAAGYIEAMGGPDLVPYVVRFELLKILGKYCLTCPCKLKLKCWDNYTKIGTGCPYYDTFLIGPELIYNPVIVKQLLDEGIVKEVPQLIK